MQHSSSERSCELGQRSRRSTTRCDIFNLNPCCALGPITAHMPPAICIGNSDPFGSHMWTDRQYTLGCSRGCSEGQRKFMRTGRRRLSGGAGSLGGMHASPVCFHMLLCGMSDASGARVTAMYRCHHVPWFVETG